MEFRSHTLNNKRQQRKHQYIYLFIYFFFKSDKRKEIKSQTEFDAQAIILERMIRQMLR